MLKSTLAILKLKLCSFAFYKNWRISKYFKILWSSEFLHNMKVVGLKKLNNFHFGHFFIWVLDQREILLFSSTWNHPCFYTPSSSLLETGERRRWWPPWLPAPRMATPLWGTDLPLPRIKHPLPPPLEPPPLASLVHATPLPLAPAAVGLKQQRHRP